MKTATYNLLVAFATILLLSVAYTYKTGRKLYRRFCIKVLWKQFHIRTSVYESWHRKRAAKLQAALDNEHSMYPIF